MSKHLATVVGQNCLLTSRNLKQNQTQWWETICLNRWGERYRMSVYSVNSCALLHLSLVAFLLSFEQAVSHHSV